LDKSQFVLARIGSAAVGALVSSFITAVAQWRERVSRQKELLFTKCVELAKTKTELLMKVAADTGATAT
jgi:hypothetical protein